MAPRWPPTRWLGCLRLCLRLQHVVPLTEPLKVRRRVVVVRDDVVALSPEAATARHLTESVSAGGYTDATCLPVTRQAGLAGGSAPGCHPRSAVKIGRIQSGTFLVRAKMTRP
jgi:hypothetical protein